MAKALQSAHLKLIGGGGFIKGFSTENGGEKNSAGEQEKKRTREKENEILMRKKTGKDGRNVRVEKEQW